jgi:hypothetical protein
MNEKSILFVPRLPARLDVNQAADILGFLPHEIVVLLKAGLLKPLGKPAPNGHKFFCTTEVSALANNRDWLDKATRTVARHWRDRNLTSSKLQR